MNNLTPKPETALDLLASHMHPSENHRSFLYSAAILTTLHREPGDSLTSGPGPDGEDRR